VSQTNTTSTANTTTTSNIEQVPLQLGQTYVQTGLIYTTTGPADDPWFCDSSRRYAPVALVHQHHPVHLGEIKQGLFPLGRVRWSQASIKRFVAGESVSPYEVWQRVDAYLRRYFVGADEVLEVVTTTVLMTYLFTVAETVPYLHLLGEPATGKSLLGDLMESICFNARQASSITAAAVYRLLHATSGTLIIDEQGTGDRTWRNVLRAGYRRSGSVTICEADIPVERRCFGPKVLMTNEPLDDSALASRTITLVLGHPPKRAKRYSTTAAAQEAAALRDDLHMFALESAPVVQEEYRVSDPIEGISHRDEDLAGLLLAVAAVVDRSSPNSSLLRQRLVDFFVKAAAHRKEGYKFEAERPTLARAVLQFIADETSAKSRCAWRGEGNWYLAADFAAYANRSGELVQVLSTKELGERLNRYGLISKRKVIDISPRDSLVRSTANRIQKVAYQFDLLAAEKGGGVS
jgi:hypothetical protein